MSKKTTKPGKEATALDVSRRKFLKVGAAAMGAGLVVTVAARNAHAEDSWGGTDTGGGVDPRLVPKTTKTGSGTDDGGWDRSTRTSIDIKDRGSY